MSKTQKIDFKHFVVAKRRGSTREELPAPFRASRQPQNGPLDQQEIRDAPGLILRNNLKAAKDNMPALSPVKLRFVHHATNLFDIPDSLCRKRYKHHILCKFDQGLK
jgi:hypothetical protein